MEQTHAFYDFCVPYNSDEKALRLMLTELVELGYKTVAIEQTYDHSQKPATKARGPDIFPAPCDVSELQTEFKRKLRILQRLTITYVDSSVTHAMSISYNVKKFNVIAGQPITDDALTHCCAKFNGDIIAFHIEEKCKLLINRKAFKIAVRRGMHFEIKYAPAITNTNIRKDMIKMARYYNTRGNLKGLILSSGAKNKYELRSPYDVAHLAFIFGMSEDQGKNAIDKHCRQVFLHAESRRIGKTVMFVKCSGPIVFSSSEESDTEMDIDVTKKKLETSGSSREKEQHPTKKLKLSEY